jgi:hypothetical protein
LACLRASSHGQSCGQCYKAKKKCEGIVWVGTVASGREEVGRAGLLAASDELLDVAQEIVSVLKGIRKELGSVRGAI